MTIPPDPGLPCVLTVLTGNEEREITLQSGWIADANQIIQKMDGDMNNGVQLSRQFIASPDLVQRCQVVSNRLLTALHTGNDALASLMAAYLLHTLPGLKTAAINTDGEANETLFYDENNVVMQ